MTIAFKNNLPIIKSGSFARTCSCCSGEPPTTNCCIINGDCVPSQQCGAGSLGGFVGSITVEWCGVSYTFDYGDLDSDLQGFCNWALGPEEGTPTGYEDGGCTSICWFNDSQNVTYKEEQAFLTISNDCITGDCAPATRTCQPCDRIRFIIGTSLRGVMFFDGFAGGNAGYDYLTGGSKVWLYKQDKCGRETFTLLSQDNCIPCGSARDACADPDASCPPDRPSFGNAACNTEPTVTLNEAP